MSIGRPEDGGRGESQTTRRGESQTTSYQGNVKCFGNSVFQFSKTVFYKVRFSNYKFEKPSF